MKTKGSRLIDVVTARALARRLLVALALICAGVGVSVATATWGRAADAPTITTDAPDYIPGSAVTYTGTGFEPGEVVDVVAVGSADGVTITSQADADGSGNIGGVFDLPYQPEPSYTLTATGESSGLVATTTFLDRTVTVTVTKTAWTEGTVFSGQVATFVDSNATPNILYSVTVNWGDGTSNTTLSVSNPPAPNGCVGTCTFNVSGAAHTYAEEGSHTLSVTVNTTNSPTTSGTGTVTVTVADAALHVSSVGAASAIEGTTTGTLTLATFTDADPTGTNADYTATIDWGDGSPTSNGTITNPFTGTFGVTGSHTYAEELLGTATYTITVTISDTGGASTIATTHASVGDNSFAIGSTSSLSAVEGASTGTVVLLPFTDHNSGATTADFTATVDWGDGSGVQSATVASTGTAGQFQVTGSHTYLEEGSFATTVHVSDDGGSAGGGGELVQVGDAALRVVATASTGTTEGNSTGSFAIATFTDADPNGTSSDYSATITWGDGTQSNGTISPDGSAFDVVASHTYAEKGTYGAVVAISDASASTGTTAVITVTDAPLFATGGSTISATEGVATGTQTLATFTDANPSATAADFTAPVTWGDGTSDNATVVASGAGFAVQDSHTYVEESSTPHTVHVTILDKDGSSASTGLAADVADGALSATAGPPLTFTEGQASGPLTAVATFTDADPGGTASDYHATIDWSDGEPLDTATTITSLGSGNFAVNSAISALPTQEGSFLATVTVSDAGGSSSSASVPVTVLDAQLTLLPTPPPAAVEGTPTTVAVANFADGNPSATAGDFTATIDWGDGTTPSTGTVSPVAGGFVVSGLHTYTEEGSPQVQVSILDDGGSMVGSSVGATVEDAPIAVTGQGPVTATEGVATPTLTVATFTDADPGGVAGDYTATIAWGDGSTSAGTVVADAGHFDVRGSNTYVEKGTYPITVTVFDSGGSSNSGGTTANVADATLHATGGTTISATEGALTGSLLLAQFTDSNPAAPQSDFTASITWGDGSAPSTGTVLGSGGVYSVFAPHAFFEEGAPSVGVSITDIDGSTASATDTALVADAALSATAGPPISAVEGTSTGTVTLATFTDADPNGTLSDYSASVTWGDGTAAETATVSGGSGHFAVTSSGHTYAEEGTYTVRVHIGDAGGAAFPLTLTATAGDAALTAGTAPTLYATEGQASGALALATFSDADPAGTATDYTATVNWGDGSPLDTGATVQQVSGTTFQVNSAGHSYTEEGTYAVSVTIQDSGGSSVVMQPSLVVADAALHATVNTIAPVEGAPFSGTVATFTDDDPNGMPTQYHATIDWGDGSTSAGTVLSMVKGAFPVSGQHTYTEEGSHTLSVTITDDPASVAATGPVSVGDAAVHITSAPAINAIEGNSYGGVIAAFTDDNPGAGTGDFSALVDWGDGTATAASVVSTAGGFEVVGSHTYADEGTFFASVSVADDGGSGDSAPTQAVVADAAVNLVPAAGISRSEGTLLSGVTLATLTDQNPGAGSQDFTAAVNWGDGTPPESAIVGSPVSNQFPVTGGSHVYGEEGTYTITVTVDDVGGQTATTTLTATIGDAALLAGTVSAPAQIEGNATPAGMSLATFTDTNPAGTAADFTAAVNWGDGSPLDGNTTVQHLTGSTFEVLADSHTYAEEGAYPISVAVYDDGGQSTTVTGSLLVGDASLTVAAPSFAAVEGAPFSGVVTSFTDSDPAASTTKEQYTATINWGDGSPASTGTVLAPVSGSFPISGSHTYAEEGPHSVTVTVSDDGGGSDAAPATIVAGDAALHITAAPAINAVEGVAYNQPIASFTDDDPAGAAGDYVAKVVWGDGTSSVQPVVASGGGFQVSGGHSYTEEAALLPASVTITDVGGSTVGSTLTANVGDAPLIAAPVTPINATEGQATGSLALGSFTDADPGGVIGDYTVSIDWGDSTPLDTTATVLPVSGTTFQVMSSGHTYAEEGTYAVTVYVADGGGSVVQLQPAAQVADAALRITPLGFSGTEGHATGPVALATLGDADPGGIGTDYTATVNWGDGTATEPAGVNGAPGAPFTISSAGHTYVDEGTYTVTVSAVDHATPVTTTMQVTIADAGLQLSTPSITATEGTPITAGQISVLTDANPLASSGDFTATIQWGDGTQDALAVGSPSAPGVFPLVAPTHTYADEGGVSPRITVIDDGGQQSSLPFSATVQDAALSAAAGSTVNTYVLNPTGPETTATFHDANAAATTADFSATIDWGDGTQSAGVVSGNGTTGFTVTGPVHSWPSVGTYSVKTAINDDGGSTANATLTANVGPIPVNVTNVSATPVSTEFSDTVTLNATVAALNNDGGTLTGNLVFRVNGRPATGTPSPAISINTATGTQAVMTTLTLDQSIVPPGAGSYSLSASFTSTSVNYANGSTTVATGVTVSKEPVTLSYTGDWFDLDTATPHLGVLVDQGAAGMDPGWVDFGKVPVSVQFSIYNVGGSLVQGPFTVPVVDASNWATTGLGSAQVNGSGPLADGSYQVVVTLVSNGYVMGPDGQAVLTSSPPTGSFITGGGFVDPDSTANSPDSNHHGNFGITVKFNKSLTNLQGNALYIYRAYMDVTTGALCGSGGGPNCRDVDVVIKSNSLTYLSVNQTSSSTGSGVITGKFSVQYNDAITGQQYTQFGFGNGTLQINVVDGGTGSSNDQYAGAFRRSDGTIFHLSTGTTTNSTGSAQLVTIKQGNITVHQ